MSSHQREAVKSCRKNPNQCFFRVNPPWEDNAEGAWTEEEIANVVRLGMAMRAADGGPSAFGNKWGLVSTFTPGRVGYDAAAVYRDVLIPRCEFIDFRYRITGSGHAVYVGGSALPPEPRSPSPEPPAPVVDADGVVHAPLHPDPDMAAALAASMQDQ